MASARPTASRRWASARPLARGPPARIARSAAASSPAASGSAGGSAGVAATWRPPRARPQPASAGASAAARPPATRRARVAVLLAVTHHVLDQHRLGRDLAEPYRLARLPAGREPAGRHAAECLAQLAGELAVDLERQRLLIADRVEVDRLLLDPDDLAVELLAVELLLVRRQAGGGRRLAQRARE